MFDIPKQKREYWNSESAKFLDEIKKEEIIHSEDKTSSVDDNIVVLQPISIESLYEYDVDCDENIVGVSYIKENEKYHINNGLWQKVEKCIDDFYKIGNIKNKISKDSLRKIVLSWSFKRKKEQISIDLTQYVENELNKLVKEYVVYFPISYLETKSTYHLVDEVFIGVFPNKERNDLLSDLREDTKHAFVYTKLEGEKQFVINKAYEQCSLVVDVIKTCYLTFYSDQPKICLDIENNIKRLPINSCFVVEASSNGLYVDKSVNIHCAKLDESFIQILKEHCINDYSQFINRIYKEQRTELEKVLILAIKTYSRALSQDNYYDRIVDLCSILDSLILSDDKESIRQALKKYVPLIITDNAEIRDCDCKNIDLMYDIRSKYIHHGDTKKYVTKGDLFKYSLIVFNLITRLVMIANNKKCSSMKEVINIIDKKIKDALNQINFEEELS